jgi:hypothetical protein
MVCKLEVKFQTTLPTPEIVRGKLKELTGLNDIELHKDKAYVFIHPLIIPEVNFIFFDTEDEYVLYWEGNKHYYLIMATVESLIRLGGKFDYPLPSWVHQKWEEVKHLFDEDGAFKE